MVEKQTVLPGIARLAMPMAGGADTVNCWLLGSGGSPAIVDTGPASPVAWHLWQQVLTEIHAVEAVLVTHHHVDHSGQAWALCETLEQVPLMSAPEWAATLTLTDYAHRDALTVRLLRRAGARTDPPPLRFVGFRPPQPPKVLADGDMVNLGGRDWRVLLGGGHTPASVCLFDSGKDILLAGDQLLPAMIPSVAIEDADAMGDPLGDYLRFLDRLSEMPGNALVLPGHGAPFRGPAARAAEIARSLERRNERILALLSRPSRCVDLLPKLFRRTDRPAMLAAIAFAHLAHLVALGRVRCESDTEDAYVFSART